MKKPNVPGSRHAAAARLTDGLDDVLSVRWVISEAREA